MTRPDAFARLSSYALATHCVSSAQGDPFLAVDARYTTLCQKLTAFRCQGDLEVMVVQRDLHLSVPELPAFLPVDLGPLETLLHILGGQDHLVPQLPEPVAPLLQGVSNGAVAELGLGPAHDHGQRDLLLAISLVDHALEHLDDLVHVATCKLLRAADRIGLLLLAEEPCDSGEVTTQESSNINRFHSLLCLLADDAFLVVAHTRWLVTLPE